MNLEGLLYNVDNEGSTLLHLAVDSGILPVRHVSHLKTIFITAKIVKGIFETHEIDYFISHNFDEGIGWDIYIRSNKYSSTSEEINALVQKKKIITNRKFAHIPEL